MKTSARIAGAVLAATFALAAPTDRAEAARKQYDDKRRGFRMKVEDSLVASPPKLTTDEAHVVAEWYEDKAKYDRGLRPTFQVVWFVSPKDAPPGTIAEPLPPPPPPPPGPETPPSNPPAEPPAQPPAPPAPEGPAPEGPAPPPGPPDEPPPEAPPVPPPGPEEPGPDDPGPAEPPVPPPAPPPEAPPKDPPDAPPDAPPPGGPPAPQDPAPPGDPPAPKGPEPPAPPPDDPPKPPEPKPPAPEPPAPDPAGPPRGPSRPKCVDDVCGRLFGMAPYFGPPQPMAERWKAGEKGKTADGVPFEWIEVNAPTKKKRKKKDGEREAPAYGFAARLTLDRPAERIEVGFIATCGTEFVKDYADEFVAMVRSFHELKSATDSRNEAAQRELSKDRTERFRQILETKVIKGWAAEVTENYILLYSKEVEKELVRDIGKQIEAIRAQVYEVLFPPDKEIVDVSIVRVCKDRDQYFAYGGPGGSAGYWNSGAEELVFFEDDDKDNSLRVLYHEAFHQYIFYSVGDFPPHSWFNEGHGDFFAGHNYSKASGKFTRDVFGWRVTTAKEWKRNPKRPPLREWIQWTQMQYYGGNKNGVPAGANYALGWSLVYFLRTTKKPEYQGVLERYFRSLKGSVTRSRDAREEFLKKAKAAADAGLPPPERSATSEASNPVIWLRDAVAEAFRGIDWDKIEKDWLASDY